MGEKNGGTNMLTKKDLLEAIKSTARKLFCRHKYIVEKFNDHVDIHICIKCGKTKVEF